jgi:hypothetical protein
VILAHGETGGLVLETLLLVVPAAIVFALVHWNRRHPPDENSTDDDKLTPPEG